MADNGRDDQIPPGRGAQQNGPQRPMVQNPILMADDREREI